MSLETTEAECAAVAVAPRVSLASMEAKIAFRYDFTGANIDVTHEVKSSGASAIEQLGLLSMCILVMQNGFTLIGKSAPASPANFNRELGKRLAYEDAIRQLWPLEGYALREQLTKTTA